MQRKILGLIGFTLLVSSLLLLSGAAQTSVAVQDPCDNFDPNVRSAASDVRSAQLVGSKAVSTMLRFNGAQGCGSPEGRRTGIDALTSALFEVGLGIANLGAPISGRNIQDYHNFATRAFSPELGYAVARAVVRAARSGFAIVPGGAAEAFNRIQTCLGGRIQANQPTVAGVRLDCGNEVVRRAVADEIAKGFYLQFGSLPAVAFDCDDLLAQAEGGAPVKADGSAAGRSTVEARWAAAQAFIEGCTNLADVATNGRTVELRAAAVGPLATQLASARGASAARLLTDAIAANRAGNAQLSLANAWAAGLLLEKEVGANAINCVPIATKTALSFPPPRTGTTNELLEFSLAWAPFPPGAAAIAPLARYIDSDVSFSKNRCSFKASSGKLSLTIAQSVPGAKLPLFSTISTL